MKSLMTLILAASIIFSVSSFVGAQVVVDADAFAPGTILNNAYAGVTLTALGDGLANSNVTSYADALASTGANVFNHTGGNQPGWGNGIFEYLRVDFASDVAQVSLDFIADDGSDTDATLKAWDSGGVLIDTAASVGTFNTGDIVTLTVTGAIAYVTAEGDPVDRTDDWLLDNLVYFDAIPMIIDIKPGSCPNPFNPKSKGSVPVGIVGTADLDVADLDPTTITLTGPGGTILPIDNVEILDSAQPGDYDSADCYDCFNEEDWYDVDTDGDGVMDAYDGDGYLDLVVKFDVEDLIDAIGPAARDDCIVLTLQVTGPNGALFEGSDSVVVLKPIN